MRISKDPELIRKLCKMIHCLNWDELDAGKSLRGLYPTIKFLETDLHPILEGPIVLIKDEDTLCGLGTVYVEITCEDGYTFKNIFVFEYEGNIDKISNVKFLGDLGET